MTFLSSLSVFYTSQSDHSYKILHPIVYSNVHIQACDGLHNIVVKSRYIADLALFQCHQILPHVGKNGNKNYKIVLGLYQ